MKITDHFYESVSFCIGVSFTVPIFLSKNQIIIYFQVMEYVDSYDQAFSTSFR
jgi:hypothetical protein